MRSLILFAISIQFSVVSAQEGINQEFYSIDSKILGEPRSYWVHVPNSNFDNTYSAKDYPVIYLLDAQAQFAPFVGVMNSMSSGINGNFRIPEAIVVGLPNTNRTRDLTPTPAIIEDLGTEFSDSGGGENFLNFLERELVPEIESRYRVLNHRTLIGHSLGGLLATQSLIAKPDLFNAYIIIDPSLWWENGLLLDQIDSSYNNEPISDTAIYIATPTYKDGNAQITSTAKLNEILESKQFQNLRTELERIPDVTHGSIPLLAFYKGLSFIYGDFQIEFQSLLDQGPDYLIAQYDSLSEKLGTEYLPPEQIVNTIAENTKGLPPELREISTRLFQLNTELYPNSSGAFAKLADSYSSSGLVDLAIEALNRALGLDPENEEHIRAIEELSD